MTRAQVLVLGLLVGLLLLLGLVVRPPELGPSTYGNQAQGLRSAHDYLQARGHAVRRWERPLDELPAADGVLVLAAPFERTWTEADRRALRQWLGQGGTVVLAASGAEPMLQERELFWTFDVELTEARRDGPLWWSDWVAWRGERVEVLPQRDSLPSGVQLRREVWSPRPPLGAEPLYADAQGHPWIWRQSWRPGALIILANPSPLTNAGLVDPANLALLEALLATGRTVTFDEFHHGHQSALTADLSSVLGPFELLMAHLLLLYGLALLVVSRPFGPVLPQLRDRAGSVSRDLEVLARLHRRAGHAREAGALLLRVARERARRRGSHPELPESFEGGEAELLALARKVGSMQEEGRL